MVATRVTRVVVALSALLVLAATFGAAPASAKKAADATMTFDGTVTAREKVGKKCRFQGEFDVTSEIDGEDAAGTVQARWSGPCDARFTIGAELSGIADVDFTRFSSTGSGNPTVLRFRGKVLDWVEPLDFMSTAGGTPTVLRFQFQGFASTQSGNPTV